MEKLPVPGSAQSPGKATGTIPARLCLRKRPGKPKGWLRQQEQSYAWLSCVLQTCCRGTQDNSGLGQLCLLLLQYTVRVSRPSCRATAELRAGAREQTLEYGPVQKVVEK